MTGIFKYFIIKQSSRYALVLFSALLMVLISGCEEDDELVAVRSIETIEPYISGPAVISGGLIKANRNIELLGYGLWYSTKPDPGIDDAVAAGTDLTVSREGGSYLMEFKSEMFLSTGTTYYLRAYIETRSGIAYDDNELKFTFN